MVNPALAGRIYPPTDPYLVGRETVRAFARAVHSTDARSLDVDAARAAGHADLIAPPTFPIVIQQRTLEQLIDDADAGVDFARVVHGDQRFTASRPILAGDELVGTMTVTSVKTLGGNAMVTAETVITDIVGEHVVTATSTLVVRGDA